MKEKKVFVVEIKNNQNASWQGSIKDLGKDVTINFRSALEMIKLLDSAVEDKE